MYPAPMHVARFTGGVLAALMIAASPGLPSAQSSPPRMPRSASGGASASFVVSASAMVTYATQWTGSEEEAALMMIIVWRGTPGWVARGDGSGSQGSSSGSIWNHRVFQSGLELEVSADFARRTATVQGHAIDLTAANTVLIDDVDTPGGPRLDRTLLIDANLGDDRGPAQILPVLGRSEEVRNYLRCDVPLQNRALQARLGVLCERILQSAR